MKIKLLCCDVFLRIVSAFVSASPHTIDVEYLPLLAHVHPDKLRGDLQSRINAATLQKDYDLFVLSYGLCGNATLGLTCPVPMVIPRVHDCCTLFMGSREKFIEAFGDSLSMRWCTSGYFERCHAEEGPKGLRHPDYVVLLEKYDRETADYIWETLHPGIETPEAAYIRIDGFEIPDYEKRFIEMVEGEGKTVRFFQGGTDYLYDLINGPWDDERFLTVQPGQKIGAVYDMERVVNALEDI
jgi:hypothetical protein